MTRHARAGRRPPVVVGLAILLLVLVSLAAAAAALRPWDAQATAEGTAPAPPAAGVPATPTPTPTPTPDPDAEFSIVAAGDVLPHLPVLADARLPGGGYDFGAVLSPMDPWVQGADLALCHLEVPVAPDGTPPSGYPLFGVARADRLVPEGTRAGTAARPRRTTPSTAASRASRRRWTRSTPRGSATSGPPAARWSSHSRSCTRSSGPAGPSPSRTSPRRTARNGMPIDADKPWSVNLIDVPALVAQATAARAAGADLVVASIHCCVEYRTEPTASRSQVDQAAGRLGRDRPGHRPPRARPAARRPPDRRTCGEGMWVAYGLGNYVSNQDGECCVQNTDSGLLLTRTSRHRRLPGRGPRRPGPASRASSGRRHGRPARRPPGPRARRHRGGPAR